MNAKQYTKAQPRHAELQHSDRQPGSFLEYPRLIAIILWLALLLALSPVAWSAPFALITNELEDTVSVIDTATNTLLATVNVSLGPEGVAVNPSGTRVYITNLASETISVIDTATNTVVATVPVDVDPYGVAVNAAGTRVYVTDLFENMVSIIDAETNSLLGTVNLGD